MADDDYLNSGGAADMEDMEDMEDVAVDIEAAEEEAGKADTNIQVLAETTHASDTLQLLFKHHPECRVFSIDAIAPKTLLLAAPPDTVAGLPTPDEHHVSKPWLTQYERTKILGFRTNQLAQGAKPYIRVPKHVVETLDIAKLELKERCLPFLVSRIMPDGSFEFWKLSDLMIL